ncbi:sensor histidine kinase [Actinospica robiniae]|uniref:sensor histidine kinase n=1 Tax=Actinospica robiniae TaxID=304901 RepID=UPI0003FFBE20|nr:nitrate- and nitrite sensing domain-containing protein [Actinospica robiniae]
MALHARTARPQRTAQGRRTAENGDGRQLSLRVVLLVLAFVPSAAMVALLADNSGQLYSDWQTAKNRENSVVVHNGSVPTVEIFYALQQERQLNAAALADPAAYKAKLAQARKATDASATILSSLSGGMPADITASLQQLEAGLTKLPAYRAAIDNGTATQQQAFDEYTALVGSDLSLFTALSKTGVADIDVKVAPTMLPAWGQEMISREDAIITAGAASGRLTGAQRAEIAQAVGAQQFIYQDEVIPSFPASISGLYQSLITGSTWQQKTAVEQSLLSAPESAGSGDTAVSPALGRQWQQVTAALDPRLMQVTQVETGYILASGNEVLSSLRSHLILQSVLGAVGVILVIAFTSWLVGRLRRRISALREAAIRLETRLPEVVERMRRGEQVDAAAELPELRYSGDELGMLGRALNAARSSALETSVRQVEQYRGFERLLQRIARRTQLLIGLQMKRLSEMERQYEDSAMLEGLFDLDHLTTRLRRYEENLVILGGGQPQRRWRKPVPLLNVLRSAQGEVQDYRRIRIDTRSRVWIAERAVGALVHMLAELMENAVSFSKPPTPVEVSAAPVSHGLAVEIEDRGVGMDDAQYVEINAMMIEPPRMDVLSRADDARLGLYVVARLAANLGVKVELRPSSFGGTRVVVLIPAELVLSEEQLPPSIADDDEFEAGSRLSAIIAAAEEAAALPVEASAPERIGVPEPEPALAAVGLPAAVPDGGSGLDPLPRRVRQASLVTELRRPGDGNGAAAEPAQAEAAPEPVRPGRAGATVGAFQRQSRLARLAAEGEPNTEEGER